MAKGARRKKEVAGGRASPDGGRPDDGGDENPDVSGKQRDGKKRKNEIDDLFSTLEATTKGGGKKANTSGTKDGTANEASVKEVATKHGEKKKSSKKVEGSKDDIFGTGTADGRKRTEEGYLIYTEDELGLGVSSKNAGYTKDCPFDCQCCF